MSKLVKQGEYTISDKPLYTYGLATCSALTFNLGDRVFMSHVDADTISADVINYLKQNIGDSKITNPRIVLGMGWLWKKEFLNSSLSETICLEVLNALGVSDPDMLLEHMGIAPNGSHFCKLCKGVSVNNRPINHKQQCKYNYIIERVFTEHTTKIHIIPKKSSLTLIKKTP
jgi:hypothetical protein